MARGESGRIVVEIDPEQKEALYSALRRRGLTLKDWFLMQAASYLQEEHQLPLFHSSVSEDGLPYGQKSLPSRNRREAPDYQK